MKPIRANGNIIVNSDLQTVFTFLSDYRNDPKWRKEINQTSISTDKMGLGTLLTEDSFLSKRNPHYISHLKCTEYIPNKAVTCETTSEAKFWAKSSRTVEIIDTDQTKVTYELEFDPAIVKFGIGFQLPHFFLNFYTKSVMKDYLAVLKKNLESSAR